MITIGSNIASLRTQRLLGEASSTVGKSFERLSSGMRINRASDDAAGLSIADSLKNSSRLYNVASRNINDGISALNIMDSALEQQISIITRLRELAEQSANGSFSNGQRKALNKEYRELVSEFGRIGDTTSFNGVRYLASRSTQVTLQAGVTGSENSSLSVSGADTGVFSGTATVSDLSLNGALDFDDLNFVIGNFGAFLTTEQMRTRTQNQYALMEVTSSTGQKLEVAFGLWGIAGQASGMIFVKDPNQDRWQFYGSTTALIDHTTGSLLPGVTSFNLSPTTAFGAISVQIDLTGLSVRTPGTEPVSSLEFSSVESVERARLALSSTAVRAGELGALRGNIGAAQSRLQTALGLVIDSGNNAQTAEARIREADVSVEAAQLVAAQIRQQTAAQLLANANTQPQLALTLLSN